MIENIDLTKTPHSSGVYLFKDIDGVVIYVGSSKDLYQRLKQHRVRIRKGIDSERNKEMYQFLQNNPFTIEFQLEESYLQIEQKLIEKYNPKFNSVRAYTGIDCNDDKQYAIAHYYKFHEEHSKRNKQYKKHYCNQMCNYKGETIKLNALSARFQRQGIPHPTIEAKKYLVTTTN